MNPRTIYSSLYCMTSCSRPVFAMSVFRRAVPTLTSSSQLTCSSKHFIRRNVWYPDIPGPRTLDVAPCRSDGRKLGSVNSISYSWLPGRCPEHLDHMTDGYRGPKVVTPPASLLKRWTSLENLSFATNKIHGRFTGISFLYSPWCIRRKASIIIPEVSNCTWTDVNKSARAEISH